MITEVTMITMKTEAHKVTGRAGIFTQAFWLQRPCSNHWTQVAEGKSIMEPHDRLGRKGRLKNLGVFWKRNGLTKRKLRREPMAGD